MLLCCVWGTEKQLRDISVKCLWNTSQVPGGIRQIAAVVKAQLTLIKTALKINTYSTILIPSVFHWCLRGEWRRLSDKLAHCGNCRVSEMFVRSRPHNLKCLEIRNFVIWHNTNKSESSWYGRWCSIRTIHSDILYIWKLAGRMSVRQLVGILLFSLAPKCVKCCCRKENIRCFKLNHTCDLVRFQIHGTNDALKVIYDG